MVYLFLANGFEEVEALCPLDLLRRAGVTVRTVAVRTERRPRNPLAVTGAHNITVLADMTDAEYDDNAPDMVILPGGMPGAEHLDKSPVVDRAIRAAVQNHAFVAAICAAPMILGHRGLLNGRKATCFPGFENELTGAEVGGKVIRDDHFITAAGMGVAQEFGLELVSVLTSPDVAGRIRASIQTM